VVDSGFSLPSITTNTTQPNAIDSFDVWYAAELATINYTLAYPKNYTI
jgi:hypothetical protein